MTSQQTSSVPVKVYKSDGRLTVAAPMPGLEPQDIEIKLTESGELTLHGMQRGTLKGENEVIMDEWNPGAYERSLSLETQVDATTANATYENGVLVVSLPVSDSTRSGIITLDRLGATEGKHMGATGHPSG